MLSIVYNQREAIKSLAAANHDLLLELEQYRTCEKEEEKLKEIYKGLEEGEL